MGPKDRGTQRAIRFLRGMARRAYGEARHEAAQALSDAADRLGREEHFADNPVDASKTPMPEIIRR